MQYLKIEHITKSYGDKILFKDISLTISQGQKIALIAKNGTGKTTLLEVIAGQTGVEGELAQVEVAKDISTAYLRQDPQFDPSATVMDVIFESDNPSIQAVKAYEDALYYKQETLLQEALQRMDDLKAWNIEATAKEVLSKLGINKLDQQVGTLSGGQQKRLALAKILIDEPDFLILDEPTNHLDLDMIEWLEGFLQRPNLTLFMVTHDRYFLERVCNEIVELDLGRLHAYRGTYSDYLEKKAARLENEAVVKDKTQKLFKRELDWVRRQPKARSTKAKSRVQSFHEIKEELKQFRKEEELSIMVEPARLGTKILEAHNISKRYGERILVDSFNYKFKKGEAVGIIGPNGAGKTTLLQLLTANLTTDTGKVVVGDTVKFGYYTQAGLQLTQDKRVVDVIRDIADYIPMAKGYKLTAEQLLEKFLFPRPQQQVYVSQLSGGEKRRLYLLTVLMQNPNFIILDEPTNDLDIITLNILEDYLLDFPGCILIVSHDRFFMDKIVDHLFVLKGDGSIRDFNGTYTEYRELELQERQDAYENTTVSTAKPASTQKLDYEQRKIVNKIEKEISKLEAEKQSINERFYDTTLSPEDINMLSKSLQDINTKLEEKELQWLELVEQMES